jgi:GYF domain 2
MIQLFLSLALSLVFGWGCAHLAARRGRDPRPWFFAGAFFGILAFAILFILPIRLRASAARPSNVVTLSSLHENKLWYYLDAGKKQYGPMSFHALSSAWKEGSVREQTFVWNEEMENWRPFKEVVQIQRT